MRTAIFCSGLLICALSGHAAPRTHTTVLGRWHQVEIRTETGTTQSIKVRRLIIDGHTREYTTGPAHEITERLFVVRRAYRINDALPDESRKLPTWVWRLDGWMSVDRQTGHISQLPLPSFDGEVSEASWYRDYVAYCGTSDDGTRSYMMVAQLGKRKAILKKEFSGPACEAPRWERGPMRVTFINGAEKTGFIVRARGVDLQPENMEEEGP